MVSLLLQIAACILCLFAAILQLAVYRSPDIVDTLLTHTARRLNLVALLVCGWYSMYALVYYVESSTVYSLGCALFAMGQLLFAANSLLKHLEKGHPRWNSHLSSFK